MSLESPGVSHTLPGQHGFNTKLYLSCCSDLGFVLWINKSTLGLLGMDSFRRLGVMGKLPFKFLSGFKSLSPTLISLTCISQVNTGPVHNDT